MINSQCLELPISRTNFICPKMFEPLQFDCTLWHGSFIIIYVLRCYFTDKAENRTRTERSFVVRRFIYLFLLLFVSDGIFFDESGRLCLVIAVVFLLRTFSRIYSIQSKYLLTSNVSSSIPALSPNQVKVLFRNFKIARKAMTLIHMFATSLIDWFAPWYAASTRLLTFLEEKTTIQHFTLL